MHVGGGGVGEGGGFPPQERHSMEGEECGAV